MKRQKNSKKQSKNDSKSKPSESPSFIFDCVLALALNKITSDWYKNRFMYSEGPERYFEAWIEVNGISCFGYLFERDLFRYFVAFILKLQNVKNQNG